MPYRVRAKQLGYYDHLRRKEGAEFTLVKAEHFSSAWMEEIDPIPKPTDTPPPLTGRRGREGAEHPSG